MGSDRTPTQKNKEAIDALETPRSRAADSANESDRTDADREKTSTDNKSDTTANPLMSFDPRMMAGTIDLFSQTVGRDSTSAKGEKEGGEKQGKSLDFRPGQKETPDSKPEVQESKKNGLFNLEELSSIHSYFSLDQQLQKDDVTPKVEIEETSSIQIRDESGAVLADGGDAIINGTIVRDPANGLISSINYPDGKVRNFSYENGQLKGIDTIESKKDGVRAHAHLVKENGMWFAEINGIKAALPGDVQFSKYGVLSFQLDQNGKWRCERPDGNVLIEKTSATGARIALNEDGSIQQVTRKDGSRVECRYDDGKLCEVAETDDEGNRVVWTKVGDKWLSDSKPPQERKNLEVFPNGNESYTDIGGMKRVITTTGTDIVSRPDGSSCEFDNEGRFIALRTVDGLEINGLKYDQQGRVVDVSMGAGNGKTIHYSRQGNTDKWQRSTVDESGKEVESSSWTGDIKITEDGAYAFREGSDGFKDTGLWKVYSLNGEKHYEKSSADGSRAIFDLDQNLISIERANGTTLHLDYENGKVSKITTTELNGDQVEYTYDPGIMQYVADRPGYRPILQIKGETSGEVSILDNASLRVVKFDGSQTVENNNKSIAEIDAKGRVISTTSDKGAVHRRFTYTNSGTLSSIHEQRKVGENFETTEIKGRDLTCDVNGTIRYIDERGQRVSITADGNRQVIDEHDRVIKTFGKNNQEREFVRDQDGEVTKIIDRRQKQDGLKVEEWERVAVDGQWTDSFARIKTDGSPDARHNVVIHDDGTYSYVNNEGHDKLARVGDRGLEGGYSDSVDEARERLVELMESHLDEPQKKRFQIILDRFEKRGKERIEAQIAAGQDPEKCEQEWDEKITKSYDNLSKMLDPNLPNATYDLRVRAKLVESAAFSLAVPVKANDQGNWGCCWMISGVFAGIIQYPDKMTDMLAQLSNTGSYTDLDGKSWTPPKGLLSITDQGGRWTIENCGGGHRSPVSEIWTSVAAYLSEDGRRTDRGSRGGSPQAMNHAMKKITGDTWTVTSEQSMVSPKMKQELLEKGAYVCIYPGHMYLGALEKHGNDWLVVASLQHGDGGRRINGTVSDLQSWNITGGRRRYNPDIDLPECQDSPTGPIGNNWPGGGGARDWPGPFPWGPDPWPLFPGISSFAFEFYKEYEKRRQREFEEFLEEQKKKKEEEQRKAEEERLQKEEEERRLDEQNRLKEEREKEEQRRVEREEKERKQKEALEKKALKEFLESDANFKRLKNLEQARAMESSTSFLQRLQPPGQYQGQGRNLSTQIIDLNTPRYVDGMNVRANPVLNEQTRQVEVVMPSSDSGSQSDETV